ncbi:GatB/YqeY domain-containing protein [Prosthecodimorpha staleyi]|uniref:GatB/YqeY domain-containing protein n=1 Tax=Prosthecodimorpha staleyi TaxID=2840188 RepID=A0A947D417_9HYPH|nr:GatB/YqeY domain-containing protein [Prosthecodimorpha staleyi]MBT9290625.1 GatB/YqeY domain-containing protein [Prosthecodimorpha staleyi]
MREKLQDDVKAAMKAGDKARLTTLRMIGAAIKDKDIAARGGAADGHISDADIQDLLVKLIKSREDSAKLYDDGGRPELADKERAEIAVIRAYLPTPMDPAEVEAAVRAVVAELGAAGMKDMGRVMAALKERYSGRMDMGKAGGTVKAALAG